MTEYVLRYKFVPQRVFRYSICVRGGLKMQLPGHAAAAPIAIDLTISQKIDKIEDNQAIVRVLIEKATADKSLDAKLLPKAGSEALMKMNDLGFVSWVGGQTAWQGAEQSTMVFPKEPVQVGSVWVQPMQAVQGAASSFFTRYRLTGINRRNRELMRFAAETFSAHPSLNANEAHSIGKGTFTFNLADCWLENCSSFINFSYQMPAPNTPNVKILTTTGIRVELERIYN